MKKMIKTIVLTSMLIVGVSMSSTAKADENIGAYEGKIETRASVPNFGGGVKWIPVGTALCPNGVIGPKCKPNWNAIIDNFGNCFNNGWGAYAGEGGCGRP